MGSEGGDDALELLVGLLDQVSAPLLLHVSACGCGCTKWQLRLVLCHVGLSLLLEACG